MNLRVSTIHLPSSIFLYAKRVLDAKWYTRAEIQEVLSHPKGTTIATRVWKKINELVDGKAADPSSTTKDDVEEDEPPFRVPPLSAIAGVLIKDWVEGRIVFPTVTSTRLPSNL